MNPLKSQSPKSWCMGGNLCCCSLIILSWRIHRSFRGSHRSWLLQIWLTLRSGTISSFDISNTSLLLPTKKSDVLYWIVGETKRIAWLCFKTTNLSLRWVRQLVDQQPSCSLFQLPSYSFLLAPINFTKLLCVIHPVCDPRTAGSSLRVWSDPPAFLWVSPPRRQEFLIDPQFLRLWQRSPKTSSKSVCVCWCVYPYLHLCWRMC